MLGGNGKPPPCRNPGCCRRTSPTGRSCSRPDPLRCLLVVPAKAAQRPRAGTHGHRPIDPARSVVMGPRLRGDDENAFADRAAAKKTVAPRPKNLHKVAPLSSQSRKI